MSQFHDKIKLILYTRVRNSTTHLTLSDGEEDENVEEGDEDYDEEEDFSQIRSC